MDEPDYNTRLEAFQEINAAIKEMDEPNVDYLMLITYNCFHFLKTVSIEFLYHSWGVFY